MKNLPVFPLVQQLSAVVCSLISGLLGSRNTIRASTGALLPLGRQSGSPALALTGEAVISFSANRPMDVTPGAVTGRLTTRQRRHILCQWADSFNLTVPLPRQMFEMAMKEACFLFPNINRKEAYCVSASTRPLVPSGVCMCRVIHRQMLKKNVDLTDRHSDSKFV